MFVAVLCFALLLLCRRWQMAGFEIQRIWNCEIDQVEIFSKNEFPICISELEFFQF
jgi:hypothetical protein